MKLSNEYAQLPEQMYASVRPVGAPSPELFAWNTELAAEIGLDEWASDAERLEVFSGNKLIDGSRSIALAYAGHQFGQFVPQLGDGRAVLLGEAVNRQGERFDVQLKGSGRTPFSRAGDGKSSLGPVVREYLLSEAMHVLGVPTTRALAAVSTGEKVFRTTPESGGILTRVASSHVRIGTFQYFAARGDTGALKALADFSIARHYPEIEDSEQPYLELFAKVVSRQCSLVAHWMSIGFIHGVMNTDNMTISGETLDYGPCAFMDEYHADKVFSSIDRNGRYAFSNQPLITHWNLARLAECLMVLDEDVEGFQARLDKVPTLYEQAHTRLMRAKFGLVARESGDAQLVEDLLSCWQEQKLDYTLSFRQLAAGLTGTSLAKFGAVGERWKRRVAKESPDMEKTQKQMNQLNPLYIPRNHQVERVIQAAFKGDFEPFERLGSLLGSPYDEQPGFESYAQPPLEEERVTQTFCGT